MKLCKDCRHFVYIAMACGRTASIEPVLGRTEYISAAVERSLGACGPEGKLWEATTPMEG